MDAEPRILSVGRKIGTLRVSTMTRVEVTHTAPELC
jgi:hypothetical protein